METIKFFGLLFLLLPAGFYTLKGILWISEKLENKK
tara:strand:- start:1026 stop:1133 length:108 start_codon:yes stop_codon:yes gene_type:complete